MGDLSKRGSYLNLNTIKFFLGLRMITLALVVGAGIMIVQLSESGTSVGPLYVLLVLSYFVGGLFYAAVRSGVDTVTAVWVLMVADIALETGIVHFSGGIASQFSLVFYLSIIGAAFLLRVTGGLTIAFLASLSHIGYGVLQNKGVLVPPDFRSGVDTVSSPDFLNSYLHVSLFFLVGAIAGYLAERMQVKGQQLQSAETELQQLKVDTDNILKHMSSGVLVIDSARRVLTINPTAEHILGVNKHDIESLDAGRVFESLMPEFAEHLLSALNAEEVKHRHEMVLKRRTGRDLPLGVSISLLKDDSDRKRGIIAVFQDLTEVREMQERVRKADRLAAIGELSAGIAHEIRNPLASISGSIEMLYNELEVQGENRRLMDLIMKESDRLDHIISDFLEFARMRPPSRDHVVLSHCLEDMLVLLTNDTMLTANIDTRIQHQDSEIMVRFDEEQMKQVFLNLAINACEAMSCEGILLITTGVDEDYIRISFSDEGPGISDEARSRLFEPFFTTKDGGTGLGLAIANKIVEAHGGRIEIKNRSRTGAEFAVVLPRAGVNRGNKNSDKLSVLFASS